MSGRFQVHPSAGIMAAVLLVFFHGARASDRDESRPNRVMINDFRVNDDAGAANQLYPAIAMHRRGPAVVAWAGDGRNGGADVYFQQFGRRGGVDGVNIKVNDDLHTGTFMMCDAAMDGEGHFVIVFNEDGPVEQSHVYAQRYMANARPLGGNIRVDDGPDNRINRLSTVAACNRGTSVVAWVDGRDDVKGDIRFQLFARDGSRLGGNVGIAVTPDSTQTHPAVAMDATGYFVLVWQDGAVRSRIMARMFDLGGTAVSPEYQVAPRPGDGMDRCFAPAVAVLPGGGFVVFWMADATVGWIQLQARLFDREGLPLTAVFRVDEPDKFSGYISDLSVAAHRYGGRTAFAWSGVESGDFNAYSRVCNASGVFSASSEPVNDRPGTQYAPDVAMDDVGNSVFTWFDDRNTDADIFATCMAPKRPNDVTAGSGYDGLVPLTWEPWYGQNIRTRYRIYRMESPETAPVEIATVDPNDRPFPDRMLDYIDTTAENGQTYYYGVANITEGSSGPTYATATASESGHSLRSAWSAVDPSLDGVLSPGEWEDATKVRMTNPDAMRGVWLYVKNTGSVLYAAVDDSNDMVLEPATSFGLFFDLDHNGKWDTASPSREGAVSLTSAAAVFQGCRGEYPNGLELDAAAQAGGIRRSFSAVSGHVQYEVEIDLAASPVRTAAGATIGAAFRVWDPGNFYAYHYANAGEWPEGSLWDAAETFGELTLASGPNAVQSDFRGNPSEFGLGWNYPNPFNPVTTIPFTVREACHVILKVHDALGNEAALLADGRVEAGSHSVRFDATGLPSGIYVVRMEAGGFTAFRKIALVK